MTELPPLFLGAYPLPWGVQIVCAIHFAICASVLACASSVLSFKVGVVEVMPSFQVAAAAWHLAGVFFIVGALVGVQQKQDVPLRMYFYYLVGTVLFISGIFVWLVWDDTNTCAEPGGVVGTWVARPLGRSVGSSLGDRAFQSTWGLGGGLASAGNVLSRCGH